MLGLIGRIAQQHDLGLVALAGCICAVACGTTTNLLARARSGPELAATACLFAAAAVFGCGVWALHFVAMLAFRPGFPINYAAPWTIASIGTCVVGALLAMIVWRFATSRPVAILSGGGLLGLAVAGMHYTGAAAMRFPGTLSFDPWLVAASLAVGIGFATLGFARAGALASAWPRLEAACWWVIGICGVHFIGMGALTLQPGQPVNQIGTIVGSEQLATLVGTLSLATLVVSLMATLLERHSADRRQRELCHVRMLGDVAREALIIQRDGIFLQANAACGRLFDVSADLLVGRRAISLVMVADRAELERRLHEHHARSKAVDGSAAANSAVFSGPHIGGRNTNGRNTNGPHIRGANTGGPNTGGPNTGSPNTGSPGTGGPDTGVGVSNVAISREIRIRTENGDPLPVELSCREIVYLGRPATVMSLYDLTECQRDEAKLRHFARHDALTGLPNRFLLEERISHDLAAAADSGARVALLYLNLDRFRPVNDLLGHAAGDALLVQVATRLRSAPRGADTVARVGGDEFVIVATMEQPDGAILLANRLIEAPAAARIAFTTGKWTCIARPAAAWRTICATRSGEARWCCIISRS